MLSSVLLDSNIISFQPTFQFKFKNPLSKNVARLVFATPENMGNSHTPYDLSEFIRIFMFLWPAYKNKHTHNGGQTDWVTESRTDILPRWGHTSMHFRNRQKNVHNILQHIVKADKTHMSLFCIFQQALTCVIAPDVCKNPEFPII